MSNRAERRRNKSLVKPKVYTLTQDQIDRMKDEATANAFKMLMSIPLVVAHGRFGFGKIRGNRLLNGTLELLDAVQKGEVDLQEILQNAEKITGVRVQKQ